MPGILWKDMTPEQIRQLPPCPDCGLPMLQNEDTGHFECVFCTWTEDERYIHRHHKESFTISRSSIPISDLGKLIRHGLIIKGMSSVQLSSKSGVSRKTIWRMARGDITVGFDKFLKVYSAMGIPLTISITSETK